MSYFARPSVPPPLNFVQGTSFAQHRYHHNRLNHQTRLGLTPPLSPKTSVEDMAYRRSSNDNDRVFYNYIRAFYHFEPNSDISSTTVTLPLEQGDIILVHSIHTNGWADGTLLDTGARGWLPTNYCEAYDQAFMSPLLKALTDFWDVMRAGSHMGLGQFRNQDYMRGLIAGVRYLLEKSDCLTRESQVVQQHDGVRRHRKALLADLSSLVKQAKQLQDVANGRATIDSVEDLFDRMLYKAFRVVTRGVKFLDIWNEDVRGPTGFEQELSMHSQFQNGPLTPPEESPFYQMSKVGTCRSTGSFSSQTDTISQSHRGSVSTACSVHDPMSNISSARASVSHRISYNSHNLTGAPRNPNLASERLTRAYDGFLGVLGSCIGLHMQSRDSAELITTTQQAVKSSQILLATVQKIWDQDMHRSRILEAAIESLNDRLAELVNAARDAFHALRHGETAGEGESEFVYDPDKGRRVVQTVTDCVKAAGDCVAKARHVLDRIGDFEIEPDQINESGFNSLDINHDRDIELSYVDVTETDNEENETETQSMADVETTNNTAEDPTPAPRPSSRDVEKPAPSQPQAPDTEPLDSPDGACRRSASREATVYNHPNGSTSSTSLQAPVKAHEITSRPRNGTVSSMKSILKTPLNLNKPLPPDAKPGSSSGESNQVDDDAEESVLEKTFAHELMWKDGQIVGATLRALIEKLTAHEATPDAVFVSTIYLTFRSFSDPVTFTEELVSRYDYISETPAIASPVRLRVYNFFKGWLESHWRDECDLPALPIIKDFAQNRLKKHLSTAGDRLEKLCDKVAIMHGPVVPRMTSCIGRANALNGPQSSDTPLPSPILSRSQTSLLRQFKANGTSLSVLDFDPTEIARQLTLKCSTVFCSILPEELLNTEWMKKTSTLAVNVRAMSTLATDLAHLVADTILSLEEPKKRAAVIKQWIKIGAKCVELNNYDSLMAIVCALNSCNISRLKRTWELLSSRTKDSFEKLHRIVDVSRNYAVLRRRLRNHVPPCLPFVGTYLTDLTFVDHGNQNTRCLRTEHGSMDVINFDKYVKTARIISDFQRFQIPYKLAEVPELQAWIQENLVRVRDLGDQNFTHNWRRSISLEPRQTQNASQEQQHYHILSSTEIKEKLEIFSRGQIRKKSIPSADVDR
ncbi:hypothetical protein KEM56_002739 [Ascosphaera pollenicola]|nr:hypothetical protein KEM56_002739 [Ascosphaera pollenicola]